MKFFGLITIAALCLVMATGVSAMDDDDKKKVKKEEDKIMCPIAGKEASKDVFAEYKDAKVYFCCNGCKKKFEDDQEKYVAKANFQLFATRQYELVSCVFCKMEPNKDHAVEIEGKTVLFGCGGCSSAVADADDKVEAVFNDKQFKNGFKLVKKEDKKKSDDK